MRTLEMLHNEALEPEDRIVENMEILLEGLT